MVCRGVDSYLPLLSVSSHSQNVVQLILNMWWRSSRYILWWPMAATWISTKKNEKPIQNKMETDFKVKVKWKYAWPMTATVCQHALRHERGLVTRGMLPRRLKCENMSSNFRNDAWKEDLDLKEDLKKYVAQLLKREEILSFVKRDYSCNPWSIRSLDRRLRHFEIFYSDRGVIVDDVRQAVAEELDGPGKLLGYRAMQKKIRQKHELNVPRDLVHAVMYELDPEGLEARGVGAKKRKPKGHFTTEGPNFVHSVDGHYKLMGYQNSTYPLAIYGCIDTATRKLLWLRIWVSNSDPLLIGRWHLEYTYEARTIASYMRMDRGRETGTMATMHAFIRRHHGDVDPLETVIYGPSTSNQVSFMIVYIPFLFLPHSFSLLQLLLLYVLMFLPRIVRVHGVTLLLL